MTMTQAEIRDIVIAKAGEDDEFRARLVTDPRAAIEGLTGVSIPDAFTVQVQEKRTMSLHLVLPLDSSGPRKK